VDLDTRSSTALLEANRTSRTFIRTERNCIALCDYLWLTRDCKILNHGTHRTWELGTSTTNRLHCMEHRPGDMLKSHGSLGTAQSQRPRTAQRPRTGAGRHRCMECRLGDMPNSSVGRGSNVGDAPHGICTTIMPCPSYRI
jgi:hypothetical protein